MPGQSAQTVGFSAISNPLNAEKVVVYRISPNNYTLGFDQRSLDDRTTSPRHNHDPEKVASTFLDPTSNVVALKFNDNVNVYGVGATSKVVALVSPFVEPINPELKANSGMIAGCTSGDKAWIVTQGQNSEKENTIFLTDVSAPKAQTWDLSASDIRDKTALSLFHDGKRLWVVYQRVKGRLVVYNDESSADEDVSKENSQFIKGTAIASVFVPASMIDATKQPKFQDGTLLGRVIIYWVKLHDGETPRLYRSHAEVNSKTTDLTFSTPMSATDEQLKVHEAAQIGFVLDKKEQLTRLYVSKKGEDNITQVTDKWFPEKKREEDK